MFDFNFEVGATEIERLSEVWLKEIEEAALTASTDDKFSAFLISVLRLGKKHKSLKSFNVFQIAETAGYARSTFFRLFENYTQFLLKAYQVSAQLATDVYQKYLEEQQMSLEEFIQFTSDVFYGVNCTIPNEVMQLLWNEHALKHEEFHPHLSDVASVMFDYLSQNDQTRNLALDKSELSGIIHSIDRDMLMARVENHPDWGTPEYYIKLKKLFHGYFLTCMRD